MLVREDDRALAGYFPLPLPPCCSVGAGGWEAGCWAEPGASFVRPLPPPLPPPVPEAVGGVGAACFPFFFLTGAAPPFDFAFERASLRASPTARWVGFVLSRAACS